MAIHYFSQELKEGENIIAIIRRHWVTFARPALKTAGVLVIPVLLIPFFLSSKTGTMIFAFWILLGLLYGMMEFLTWYLDSIIITNFRVIDIDQQGLFHRTVSEAALGNIQDVRYSIEGFFATLFGYGNCFIQTAGSKDVIEMHGIAGPQRIQEKLLALKQSASQAPSDDEKPANSELSAKELIAIIQKEKTAPPRQQGIMKQVEKTEKKNVIDLSRFRPKRPNS